MRKNFAKSILLLAAVTITAIQAQGGWSFEQMNNLPIFYTNYPHSGPFAFAYRAVFGSRSLQPVEHYGIAYFDESAKQLMYSTRAGSSWTAQIVESTGNTGQFPSLAFDANGRAHIVYFKKDSSQFRNELRYAHQVAADKANFSCGFLSNWQCETVSLPGSAFPSGLSSIAIDKNSVLHVALVATGDTVIYVYKQIDSMGWEMGEQVYITLPAYPYFYTFAPIALSLKLDSQSRPHLMLREGKGYPGRLLWAHRQSLAYWPAEIVAAACPLQDSEYQSMELGSDDQPRILFNEADPTKGALLALKQRALSGSWTQTTVDSGAVACSLTLDPVHNYPRVAYYSSYWQVLKYAQWFYDASPPPNIPLGTLDTPRRGIPRPNFFTSGWSKMDVTTGQDIAVRNSTVLDVLGRPIIVYYDKQQGYFRFAKWN